MPTRAIKAIFFARFHHEIGSRVLHQVPEGSITTPTATSSSSTSALSAPLFDFDSCTTYLIPTQQFCDRLLTFCTNHHRVIGYPVCIREGKYSRNEFIFNFAIVIEEGVGDWQAYGEVARKMGTLLRGLEEQGGFLSREEEEWGVWSESGNGNGIGGGDNGGTEYGYGYGYGMYGVEGEDGDLGLGWGGQEWSKGGSRVYALCEMIMEDLNNYAECMIPIDDSNTINLKLFPTHPPPPPISLHQVPLLTISLRSLTSPISSDLTLMRIVPFINGVNSVAHIAQLADTELSLTRKAIQHLVYYGCLVLLDVFSFGAIYAPTAEIGGFITEKNVQEECARYVQIPGPRKGRSSTRFGSDSERSREDRSSISSSATTILSDIASPTNTSSLDPNSRRDKDKDTSSKDSPDLDPIAPQTLITLYTNLRHGLPLKSWVLENLSLLPGIDIRRLITFGIIKGFLYRIHKYAIVTSPHPHSHSHAHTNSHNTNLIPPSNSTATSKANSQTTTPTPSTTTSTTPTRTYSTSLSHKPSLVSASLSTTTSSTTTTTTTTSATTATPTLLNPGPASTTDQTPITRLDSIISTTDADREREREGLPLVKFLDGMHSFDEICMEVGVSEGIVERKIRGMGDVQVLYR